MFDDDDVPPSLKGKVPTTTPHPHHKRLRIGALHVSALKVVVDILRQMYQNLGMISFQVASFVFYVDRKAMVTLPALGLVYGGRRDFRDVVALWILTQGG